MPAEVLSEAVAVVDVEKFSAFAECFGAGSTVSQTAHLVERGAFVNVHAGHVRASATAWVVLVLVPGTSAEPPTAASPWSECARLQLANSGPE